MAEDIYQNKTRYERQITTTINKHNKIEYTLTNKKQLLTKPEPNTKRKYYCKNPNNTKYFLKLAQQFDLDDLSYIRRNRLLSSLKAIVHYTDKDLKDCTREDINTIVTSTNINNKSPKSRSDFIKDMKRMWKILLPEKDNQGREDETVCPYPVRHLKTSIDKSKQRSNQDKLTIKELDSIYKYFENNPMMQFYIALITESLGRPQEVLYTKIGNIEQHDDYAIIHVVEHGKEGTKFLKVVDGIAYLNKWLKAHPASDNPDSYIFIYSKGKHAGSQANPESLNKKIKIACTTLGINKPITNYSFKRNGVTFARLQGRDDVDIQKTAGWTSTRQLATYDQSTQHDVLKRELVKKGLLQDEQISKVLNFKLCFYCKTKNAWNDNSCSKCQRILDRDKLIESEAEKLNDKLQKRLEQLERTQEKMFEIIQLQELDRAKKLLN